MNPYGNIPPRPLGQTPMGMYPYQPQQYQQGGMGGMVQPPQMVANLAGFLAAQRFPVPLRPQTTGTVPVLAPVLPVPKGPVRPPTFKPPLGASLSGTQVTEKPHTTVYVGKISPLVDDTFLKTVLELCGPVKSWKRAQDPSTGKPKGFGFCEFEAAEGVLRALRILHKYSLEGQELVLNVNQATREYLDRYSQIKNEFRKRAAEKKNQEQEPTVSAKEDSKSERDDASAVDEANQTEAPGVKKVEASRDGAERTEEEEKAVDEAALSTLKNMVQARAKMRPPAPPPLPPNAADKSPKPQDVKTSDLVQELIKAGMDSARELEGREAEEDGDRTEAESLDKGRSSRDRGGKERDADRYEREREKDRERARLRREREREMRISESERNYEIREREWEIREKEKERDKLKEKEREKERERERRREIKEEEEESDDERGYGKRRLFSDEARKRRQRELEEDELDRLTEERELREAKRLRLLEPPVQRAATPPPPVAVKAQPKAEVPPGPPLSALQLLQAGADSDSDSDEQPGPAPVSRNGPHTQPVAARQLSPPRRQLSPPRRTPSSASPAPQIQPSGPPPAKKPPPPRPTRAVPSVFAASDDEDEEQQKRRPFVPLDYSTEEMAHAARPPVSATPPSPPPAGASRGLAGAAEFAKSLAGLGGPKEERKERRGSERERESRRDRERERERRAETPEKREVDAKSLIDSIPKTKGELFSYPINWTVFDQEKVAVKLRPWISKKITEFLGEEEKTLVDFIVQSTEKHEAAPKLLELLESLLDEEAEMFVLKMWRMLIFEIKRAELGLSRSKA